MSDLRVSRLWCLNDQAVPLVEAAVDIQDLENLLPEGDKENMSVLLLNLKAGTGHWIEKALQLPNKFWNSHACDLPFLKEIKEAIVQAKRSHPLLRSSQALVLKIRGLPLMAMNDSRGIRIAIDPQEVEESLLWCFGQIQKDIKSLNDASGSSSKGDRKRASHHALEEEHIEKALHDIVGHKACLKVRWCPSRMSFKVWKVAKHPRQFGVHGLNKKRKQLLAFRGLENHLPEEDFQALASSFQTAATKAVEYLEEAAASTPTAPAACNESDSPAGSSSPTLSLGECPEPYSQSPEGP